MKTFKEFCTQLDEAAWNRRITNSEVVEIVNAMRSRGYLQDP